MLHCRGYLLKQSACPLQADMKTVKYQIVRMMRMLIQVPYLYSAWLSCLTPVKNSNMQRLSFCAPAQRCILLQICTTLGALPEEVCHNLWCPCHIISAAPLTSNECILIESGVLLQRYVFMKLTYNEVSTVPIIRSAISSRSKVLLGTPI